MRNDLDRNRLKCGKILTLYTTGSHTCARDIPHISIQWPTWSEARVQLFTIGGVSKQDKRVVHTPVRAQGQGEWLQRFCYLLAGRCLTAFEFDEGPLDKRSFAIRCHKESWDTCSQASASMCVPKMPGVQDFVVVALPVGADPHSSDSFQALTFGNLLVERVG